MHTFAVIVVGLYALLNLALAVAARARQVPGASAREKLPAVAIFALSGVILLAGVVVGWWPPVAAGLVLASGAALVYAVTVERHVQPLHHVVRGLVAAGMMILWLQT